MSGHVTHSRARILAGIRTPTTVFILATLYTAAVANQGENKTVVTGSTTEPRPGSFKVACTRLAPCERCQPSSRSNPSTHHRSGLTNFDTQPLESCLKAIQHDQQYLPSILLYAQEPVWWYSLYRRSADVNARLGAISWEPLLCDEPNVAVFVSCLSFSSNRRCPRACNRLSDASANSCLSSCLKRSLSGWNCVFLALISCKS